MTIYLYVKTHTITGLKYLGKTKSKDPHKYPGSGTYWRRHLKTHGVTYTTEILQECQTDNEVTQWGLHYSELWDVVASNEWANLKPEAGDGGGMTPDIIAKVLATKRANGTLNSQTPDSIAKGLETRRIRGKLNTTTPDSIAKQLETRRSNGTLNPNTPDSIAKRVATRRAKDNYKLTPEAIAKQLETKRANGTLNSQTPESIAKMMETKRARGNLKRTPESIAKMLASRARNKAAKALLNSQATPCPLSHQIVDAEFPLLLEE